jgi:hypothetical protein
MRAYSAKARFRPPGRQAPKRGKVDTIDMFTQDLDATVTGLGPTGLCPSPRKSEHLLKILQRKLQRFHAGWRKGPLGAGLVSNASEQARRSSGAALLKRLNLWWGINRNERLYAGRQRHQ